MSLVLEGTVPPPHLLQSKSASWPCSYPPLEYPALVGSPTPMSPQSLQSYLSRVPESPLRSQDMSGMPTSGWYAPSVSAPQCHDETGYAPFSQYVPPHTSSLTLSPPTPAYHYAASMPVSTPQLDPSSTANSPRSVPTKIESARRSVEPTTRALEQPTARWRSNSHLLERPTAHLLERPLSSSSMHSAPLDGSWTMNPLGIHGNNMPHDYHYSTYPGLSRSPRLSEPLMELPSHLLSSPQPRRMYTPIAPQPHETPRSHGMKRSRDDDDEFSDEMKRRKRSDSNTSATFELSEEDKLLLQLKEEEAMPWKDIAQRFQSDLGKSYQIPALQMRLKRLRERMRVWTDTDVRALKMAHEYWAQNKFDIIAQKMLEFGAQEKWTARQCARKWSEVDPAPAPYAPFEHLQHGFAPYAMSPVEPPHPFLPYMNHVQ